MACTSLPQLGCCGGEIVPARQVQVSLIAKLDFSAFTETPFGCWPFYKTRKSKLDYLLDPAYKSYITEQFALPRSNTKTLTVDESNTFVGFFQTPPTGWETDPPLNIGGFVAFRKYRPNGTGPGGPWHYQLTVEHSDPYTEADAMAEFMVLFNQINVMDKAAFNLCRQPNANLGGTWTYDRSGNVSNTASPYWANARLSCQGGPLSPDRGGFRGGTVGFTKYVNNNTPPLNTDMGHVAGGTFEGVKMRVRMDRSACIWKYQAATPCAPSNAGIPNNNGISAGVPVCGAPGCTFIPLPTQDVPGCLAIWPRYVEFGLLPDGVDPVTGLGEPTPDIWYTFAGCTECFTSR